MLMHAVTPISCAPTVLKVDTPGTSKSPPNCTAPVNVEAPDTSTVADVNDAVTPISCAPTVLKVDTPGTSKSPPNCTAPVNVEAPDTSTVADVNACSNANIMCSNST